MKKHILLFIAILALMLHFLSCQKEDNLVKEPIITENSLGIYATQVFFYWTVDYPGKIASVVEISPNADMTNSQRYGSESYTDDRNFTATATGLDKETTYYYRYLVWNPNNSFEYDTMSLSTLFSDPLFSVSSSAKVLFSSGNLQYQASTDTWRFAEHQYDVVGNDNSNISSSYSGWIDLFGWGTSGYNGLNPYTTYYYDFEDIGLTDIAGTNYDWGVYNKIANGGNQAGLWRTLTLGEWMYVFDTRSTASGILFAKACVNNNNGVILLPDDWSSNYYSLSSTNYTGADFSSNIISASNWSILERHGAVFLPAAGIDTGTSVNHSGSYWSASCDHGYDVIEDACCVYFWDDDLYTDATDFRAIGRSVRLVHKAQ